MFDFANPEVRMLMGWDEWRAAYRTMSFAEHQAFYVEVARAYPYQRHYHVEDVLDFVSTVDPSTIVEVGGWDGTLAMKVLPNAPGVKEWVNYEICPTVPVYCRDERFHQHTLECWPWELDELSGDAMVLSHVVEHMLLGEFGLLLDRFPGRAVFIECPVTDGPQDWTGYDGSHIIERGWDGIEDALVEHGFVQARNDDTIRWYEKQS